MSSLTDALTAAVLLHQNKITSTHKDVVAAAKAFHDFLVSAPPTDEAAGEDARDPTTDAAPTAPTAPPRPRGRPPKAASEQKPAAAPQKPAAASATADDVGNAISQLLAADKRDAAVALLGKFPHVSGEGPAKSKSTLRPQDYGAFVSQAKELLAADGDLS